MDNLLEETKRYIGLTEAYARLLAEAGPGLERHLPEMAELFYQRIMENPETARIFSGPEQLARLKLTQRLEAANLELAELGRVKDEFLAHTSHELRTPLNSILGFTKLILDGLCHSPEEERELQRDVFESAQHLLGIVNDILDIAKIEAGKLKLSPERIELRPLFDQVLAVIAVQADEKKLKLVDETAGLALP